LPLGHHAGAIAYGPEQELQQVHIAPIVRDHEARIVDVGLPPQHLVQARKQRLPPVPISQKILDRPFPARQVRRLVGGVRRSQPALEAVLLVLQGGHPAPRRRELIRFG
jgi:hypothetical protein